MGPDGSETGRPFVVVVARFVFFFFLPLERFGRLAKGGRREVCGVEMWLRVVNWRVDQLLAYRSFACLFLSDMLAPGDGFRYGPFFASPGGFPFGLSPQFDGSYLSLSRRRMFHLHEMVHHSLLTARTSLTEGDSAGFFLQVVAVSILRASAGDHV